MRRIRPGPFIRVLAGDLLDEVPADETWRAPCLFNQTLAVEIFGGEDGLHRAGHADMLCEGPRIHSLHSHDAVTDQIIGKGFVPAPVAEDGAVLFDDESFDLRRLRFDILLVDSVIADERVCHDHDLTFVGRIGKDLLVACHAGVEDDLPRLSLRRTRRIALRIQSHPPRREWLLGYFSLNLLVGLNEISRVK